jgi:hypothetical protein
MKGLRGHEIWEQGKKIPIPVKGIGINFMVMKGQCYNTRHDYLLL